jgi:uncharacterized membrane protein YczE
VLIMGISVSASIYSGLGTDPCTCINLGISGKIGVPYWLWQCIFNAILFLFPLIFSRKLIGFGTVVSMFFVGIVADMLRNTLYRAFLPAQPAVWVRIVFMLAGALFLGIGASFYMVPSLGVSPYDSIPLILKEHLPFEFRWIRVTYDVTAVIIGWLLGSAVGIGTVLVAFGLGPMIHFFARIIQKCFLLQDSTPAGQIDL